MTRSRVTQLEPGALSARMARRHHSGADSSHGSRPRGGRRHAKAIDGDRHGRVGYSPDIPLTPWLCVFSDNDLELVFRYTTAERSPVVFAAMMLATAVLMAVAAALAYYLLDTVEVLMVCCAVLFMVWVLARWAFHRLVFGSPFPRQAALGEAAGGAAAVGAVPQPPANDGSTRSISSVAYRRPLLMWWSVAGVDAVLCACIMVVATLWAFLEPRYVDDIEADGWLPAARVVPSEGRIYGAVVVAVLPLAFGLDYLACVVAHGTWFLAFCAMTIAYCVEDGSHIIYGAVLWAAVLLAALQVWCRRFAAMNRSRWYVKNVLDVIVTSPASTSMASSFLPASPTHSHAARRGAAQAPRGGAGAGPGAASVSTAKPSSGWQSQAWSGKHSDVPARSEDSHASPSSPTGTRRQPVVERLVSMLNRVRHDTANPNIAGDLAMAIEILYENPDALTAGYTTSDVQGLLDIDETTAEWMSQTLTRRLPSFSAARRKDEQSSKRRVLLRQSSSDKATSDDEFDGVVGRVRSSERELAFGRVASASPVASPHGVVRRMLQHVDSWEFDVFEFSDVCHGRPLATMLTHVLRRFKLIERHSIDMQCLAAFVNKLEWEYCYNPSRKNPYHSNIHAADVTQAVVHFMTRPKVRQFLDHLDVFSIVIGAAVHDYRHPGVTNNYLIATQSKLALRYNDMSILENFHICEAFRAMRHRSRNILKNLTTADALTMRYTVIQCVLATDLSLGPRYIAAFESRAKRTDFGHDDEDKLLLLQQMLKCADVSHATRPVRLHIRWSHLITEEFYLQGDTELEMGLPLSPLCDRKDHNIAKSQRGFISFVVRPCFTPWAAFCKNNEWTSMLAANFEHWQASESSPHVTKQAESLKLTGSSASTGPASPPFGVGAESPATRSPQADARADVPGRRSGDVSPVETVEPNSSRRLPRAGSTRAMRGRPRLTKEDDDVGAAVVHPRKPYAERTARPGGGTSAGAGVGAGAGAATTSSAGSNRVSPAGTVAGGNTQYKTPMSRVMSDGGLQHGAHGRQVGVGGREAGAQHAAALPPGAMGSPQQL